jgi:hypothetical protein
VCKSGNSVEDQGCNVLESEYGTHTARLKASLHWKLKVSNPVTTVTTLREPKT